jgi:DmsE family decaheme c-type cytochrome
LIANSTNSKGQQKMVCLVTLTTWINPVAALEKHHLNWPRCIIGGVLCVLANLAFSADVPCGACHTEAAARLTAMPHGEIDGTNKPQCSSCHGDGQAHLAAPGPDSIVNFNTTPVAQQNTACGGCHNQAHQADSNAHSAADVPCSACHSIHGKKNVASLPARFAPLEAGSRLCYGCHEDTFTQFAHNERHRLQEGSLTCTSCHDAHNPSTGMLLGGFKPSLCSNCHADVEGPFVFEHAASRVEGCVACHAPHGSPNRHLLVHQDVGALCYSCHVDAPQFHLGFSLSGSPHFDEKTVCTNCHVAIHGSNIDRALLR